MYRISIYILIAICWSFSAFCFADYSYDLRSTPFDDKEITFFNSLWNEELIGNFQLEEESNYEDVKGDVIENESYCFLIFSIQDNKNCGYLAYTREGNEALLGNIFLEKSYRGRGIGEQILSLLELKLKQQGLTSITLTVLEENKSACRLYQKCGFKIVHEGSANKQIVLCMRKII